MISIATYEKNKAFTHWGGQEKDRKTLVENPSIILKCKSTLHSQCISSILIQNRQKVFLNGTLLSLIQKNN